MRTVELHFASIWAWLLLLVVPMLVIGLFTRELRRRVLRESSRTTDADVVQRALSGILALVGMASLAGILACGWVLVATREQPFESPVLIGGLISLGLAMLLSALGLWLRRRHQPVFVFSGLSALKAVREGRPGPLRWLVPVLRLLAVLLIVLALARPQVATTESDVFAEGMDIIFTLDVSGSMEAVDFAPPGYKQNSRLNGAKDVIARFIQQRKEDRLGLVVFASEAFTQSPLTLDYSILYNILGSLRTGVIEDGTAIGNALMVAINRLRDSDAKSKVIVLLTDGDDNASRVSPVQAAEIASKENIRVFPILVGKGGLVPFPVKDRFGGVHYRNVEIRTDPDLLKNIARLAKGKFYRAEDQNALERDLQDILDHMEKSRQLDPGRFTRKAEMFQLALLPALLALLIELVLSWTRFRRFP